MQRCELVEPLTEQARNAMIRCLNEYQWSDFDAVEIHPGKYDEDGELDHCDDEDEADCYMVFLHLIRGGLVDLTECQYLDAAEIIEIIVCRWLLEPDTRPDDLNDSE